MCDEDVAALVVDNGAGGYHAPLGSSRYAKVDAEGIVTEIGYFKDPPSSDWKACSESAQVGLPL